MGEEAKPKWEGKASAKLKGPKPDQVWPLIEDFCAIQKWLPAIATCYQVEGVYGQPGLIRYCASATASAPTDDGDAETIKWTNERLVEINPIERFLSYEIGENNVGFQKYVGTMKVSPINGDDDEEHSCLIEWSYVADPNESWSLDEFNSYLEYSVVVMAERMEKALLSNE